MYTDLQLSPTQTAKTMDELVFLAQAFRRSMVTHCAERSVVGADPAWNEKQPTVGGAKSRNE